MTRWRKEILKKMIELDKDQCAEYEMSCGYFTSEISEAFNKRRDILEDEMAKSYGMTREEYDNMCYENQNYSHIGGEIPLC